nr:ferredoxin [Paracoccus sp. S-4012]
MVASPEWQDGEPNPVDRWSARVIGALAAGWDGRAVLPSDGPPYPPFQAWAVASGRAWVSPVGMLVHAWMGLWASFRGAVLLDAPCPAPPARPAPCETCPDRPCLSACPVGALGPAGYDLAACHGQLDRPGGADCMTAGCLARRACPAGQGYGRLPGQSAYHMRQFHR